jgi:hypothetical protein
MAPVVHAQAREFAEIARGFCLWCESPTPGAATDSKAAAWLCRLYAAALGLPKVGAENSDGLPDLPPEGLQRATANLARWNSAYYREFYDPHPHLSDEPVVGDIGDDLLGTYKDIRAGLLLYERGAERDALWHWSFLHQVHWGRHAVGAIFALHCLAIGPAELDRYAEDNAP